MSPGSWEVASVMRRKIVNEADWLETNDPDQMLAFLRDKMSDRRAKLFESACFHRLWLRLREERYRSLTEALDRLADGPASAADVETAQAVGRNVREEVCWVMGGLWNQSFSEMEDRERGAHATAWRTSVAMRVAAARLMRQAMGDMDGRPSPEEHAPEARAHCAFLRDIVGDPFRAATADPAWIAWHGSAVRRLAQSIYDERAFERLPVLADALEEAGCTSPDILDHCRGPGPHVRGCWVVDLLLGKA